MTVRVNACYLPRPVSAEDAGLYERLRAGILRSHCADGRDEHRCCGRVTLDRYHLTLQCRLCGDARLNLKEAGDG